MVTQHQNPQVPVHSTHTDSAVPSTSNGYLTAGPGTRIYGITSPISYLGPTPEDTLLTKKLEECLQEYNLFENDDEMNKRCRLEHLLTG